MFIRKGKPTLQRFFLFSAIFLLIFGSFFIGFSLGQKNPSLPSELAGGKILEKKAPPPHLLKDVDFQLFWQVWNILQSKYFEQPVGDTKLFYGALRGLVGALDDPHSSFLDPTLMAKFEEELSGTFEGIGAELAIKNKRLTIVAPLPSSPAEKAGLKPKDWIVKIDGEDTAEMPIDEAVSKIRGKEGTEVKLAIFREGFEEPKEFTVVRQIVQIVSVQYEAKGPFAYVRILHFDENSEQYFRESLEKILAQNPQGIILDLRNNPGGLLDAAVNIAGAWLPENEVVVIEQWPRERKNEYRAPRSGVLQRIPTVVLINEGSASGSEIVAGALQDHKKAKLVGKKTFGKGSVQELEKLSDGSALKITVAKWLTPSGRQINDTGIAPDEEVELKEEDFAADRDPQLERAMELLKQ